MTIAALPEQQKVCPVENVKEYAKRTAELRTQLPTDHKFFLAGSGEHARSASTDLVANWITRTLTECGVTGYTAHSSRSAAATHARLKGTSLADIKRQANWSAKSTTFEQFYFRPGTAQRADNITSTILAPSGKGTTDTY